MAIINDPESAPKKILINPFLLYLRKIHTFLTNSCIFLQIFASLNLKIEQTDDIPDKWGDLKEGKVVLGSEDGVIAYKESLTTNLFIQIVQSIPMERLTFMWLALLMLLFHTSLSAAKFDISKTGKDSTRISTKVCNIQTTLEFKFNVSSAIVGGASTGLSYSKMKFLDTYGNDLELTLTDVSISTTAADLVTGYSIVGGAVTAGSSFIFEFSNGSNIVYVWIPLTIGGLKLNPDLVDLTDSKAPSNSINGATFANGPLTAFNFFDQTDYNQWYTTVVGTKTLLASKFIYKVSTLPTPFAGSTAQTAIQAVSWDNGNTDYGNKLCYASTETTGNFQTHLRESVPLWFIWVWIFIYWLIYLLTDSNTIKCFDKKFENNNWTCWSLYSIWHLANEDFFTRLLRLTVILMNWTIQGLFLACIYGNQPTLDAPMIIWTAVIAFVATIPFPFIWGSIFHRKIYEKNLIKYENMKGMRGLFDKEKIEPFEREIDTCEEKLYGYNHWYYCIVFALFFICWPIAINQMQRLPRQSYHYHWYWLASMGICFALEYFIFEPLLVLIWGNTRAVRNRGGHYYNIKMGEAYRAATI